ncbi:hypothetical protein B7Y94_06200 [Candidatus Saccharibacteria bacterium 32-49-12]|nr:MAG: hypothetical protein B7Y94_06200 [Candidatus Saccharibacteria bacterium 32-49-12]
MTRLTANWLDYTFAGLLLVVLGGVFVHAPLTIWLGSFWPDQALLIKAWKEILLILAVIVGLATLWRHGRWTELRSSWVLLPVVYGTLHLALLPLFNQSWTEVVAGLMIDLRYIVYFVLTYLIIRLYPGWRPLFLRVVAIGMMIVGGFGLLQVLVLPADVLTGIGYGEETIQPYLTVDENPDYVRINSTMRGPNPLGAIAAIGLTLGASWLVLRSGASRLARWQRAGLAIGGVGLAIALWASYSRSAVVAAIVAVGLVLLLTVGRRLPRAAWIGLFVVGFGILGGLYAGRDSDFVSNVILHENEGTGALVSSNDGHVESLIDGTERLVRQPLGAGIGSTGSASLLGDEPLIIENQYLFIAHEVGWIGLGLFTWLFGAVLLASWRQRRDWRLVITGLGG